MVSQLKPVKVKHVLIAAGGTGGHVYPALAVADYLREHGIKVTWIGTEKGLEHRVVPAANISLEIISISGLRGKGILNLLFVPLKLIVAVVQVIKIFIRIKPDAVLGMGGFVSGPCGLAAFILGKPLYLHEQNAIPGLTNKVLSHLATTAMQAFPHSLKIKNTVVTGNPVRKDISDIAEPESRMAVRKDNIRLLIVGGSLGAQALNENVPQALSAISKTLQPNVWHQTGKNKLDTTIENYRKVNIEAKVTEFIENMAEAYEWADLVICRAGALTISELANAGVAAILVPYPHAVDDHQTANAHYLTKVDAAILIQQEHLMPKLKEVMTELLQAGRTTLIDMAKAARKLSKPDATKTVAEICLGVSHG
ncbi:MAG: undecaprenyldiphospho-muramoylpentapeptide beta-N-acetylglucosaminyltransferase [Gammaproteobacteria bacterium]|nr:undecaprenyldiphospho-muramoylpentapeptide beta-N-acetylglucosaminyltransferase [Gammaproteobacteria bacterium]MCW8987224.1 undecaprenyldiphospho-muramoylpentapeptide beta-N-acetylglucosaminyltransferase [Gammaproteobacteria bacterium]MCW9031069.1 undecaprenyldiphospho-muramoylpentapeptide beta-N-acetylglucosaminyltransferase [Gammaproteobacteria bacterium]